jgi:glc operon protein GlcG
MNRRTEKGGRRSRGRGAILALAVVLIGPVGIAIGAGKGARGQEIGPGAGRAIAEIRDRAGLFGADAIASARGELERVARETGASIIIETVDTLDGEPADREATRLARQSGIRGVFILIARKERKLEVLGSGHYKEIVTEAHRRAIRDAFFEGFRRQDFNEGLKHGVAELARVMATARHAATNAPRAPVPEAPSGLSTGMAAMTFGPKSAGDSPLVAHNQVRLTLAGARAIVAGAEARAQAMGLKSNIAVVDDGGHLIAFERMEGARPASVYTALTKATTAATFRQPTGPLPSGGTASPDPLLNLSLQNAAAASGGKITTLYGGVPVVVDGQVIGGVGVGGGTGEQDAQIARAGIQAFTDQLAKPAGGDKENRPERVGLPGPHENGSPDGQKSNAGSSGKRDEPDF